MAKFPENPTLTDPPQTHTEGDVTWEFDGEKWVKQSPTFDADYVTQDEFEKDQDRQDQDLNDALHNDPDTCDDYTAVDNVPASRGEIYVQDFFGRTRLTGQDPEIENSTDADVKLTYEDGTEYVLTSAGMQGSGSEYWHQYNELIPAPPNGSTVNYCLIDVNNPDVYVPYEEFIVDQERQDTRDVVLEAEILALAAKTKLDQAIQDKAIDDLETALYGEKCDPEDITTELVFGYYNNGDDATKVYWSGTYLEIPNGWVWGWGDPSSPVNRPDALYINGVEHEVTQGSNTSGIHWMYYLSTAPDAALDGEIVTVSQCPPSPTLFVTQEEFEKDQDRQDQELADYKQEVKNEIVELEQELEALAPSLDRGNWKYSDSYSKPVGYYGARTGGGFLPTGWDSIGRLTFNEEDETGTTHTFTDIKDGTYIQIFEQGSETAALFQATAVATRVDGDQLHIDVTHVQSVSGTTPQPDKSYRFKIFELTDDTDTTAFVLKTGDSMSGRLLMEDANIQINADDLNKSYIDFRRPSGEFITAVNFVHNGTIPNTIGGYDINLQGYTSYNRLRLTGRNSASNPLMFEARADGTMGFYYSVDFNNKKITSLGDPTDDPDAANKKYVDERDELLRQDIIELEEEIDAIAPSVEYGTWEWRNPTNDNVTRPPDAGTFFLIDASNPTLAVVTDQYKNTTRIAIHNDEYVPDGSTDPVDTHYWTDADPGKLIQLFDAADPDFLLAKITAINIDSGFVYLDVQLIQTSGQPNDNPDTETGKYLTRVNIFDPPTGGDVSGFVMKTGDTMTGNLIIDKSTGTANVAGALTLKGERSDAIDSTATIKFENANNSSNPGYLTYRSYGSENWFRFDRDVDLNSKGLSSVGQIRMNSGGSIGSGSKERIVIKDGDNSNAGVHITRPGEDVRTFSIAGKPEGSDTAVDDFFFAYANSGSDGDAINYKGKITTGSHITNKKYVDEAIFDDVTDATTNKFVKRSGDSMTGALQITHASGLDMQGNSPVRTRFIDSAGNSNLQIKRNGNRRMVVGDTEILFDKIGKYTSDVTLTEDGHIPNKKYVDDAVASAGSGLPTGGSDGQVLKIRRSDSKVAWEGAIDIGTSGNGRAIGEMWYNPNDGTLYLKVS